MNLPDGGALPSADELLSIERARVGKTALLTLTGEVDTATAPQLRQAVHEALTVPDAGPIVVDMTAVTFLSSAGLGALVSAHHDAARHGEPLRVVVDHARPVLRPLQISGLDHVLTLFHYVDTALQGDPTSEGHDGDANNGDTNDIEAT
ncbi:STAS domain-containing protein [Pseudonocardia sp. TRM90224]|uniref:STAS domain-containing protein n=1 Tax=Pseudonocardia sp. TRM90224 TaxID=2812678 RepID=UPI001E3C9770|nr:STAS domain-containing protein [Pseudonocardia sp. TRM90224]